MSKTIQDLYESFSTQMEPIQEEDRYFRYLFELAQASDTTIEQKREEFEKVVDEEWLAVIEDSLDAINTIIEKPRRFITTEEEVVPVSLARRISADSVRHLSQNTQFLAPSEDGEVRPTHVLNVNTVETYDLYENRFVYHLIQRLLAFIDKRTDVIFWATGNEVCNRFKMHSKIGDAYEEIEYTVEMSVKNRQSFAENDADNTDAFMRIDRVRRLVSSLANSSFCKIMAGCAVVRSPIQRTNLMTKDPNYRACYRLWQFMERYDEVGYTINVKDSAMAFDDEYVIQMYTNLINNYAVFKSLTEDERNLAEAESVRHDPVKPKFVKELREEFVDSPDLPDVEIRRIFVEEVTQAQLEAQAALEKERESAARLQAQIEQLTAEVNALTDERDSARQAASEASEKAHAALERVKAEEDKSRELSGELAEKGRELALAAEARQRAESACENARLAQAEAEDAAQRAQAAQVAAESASEKAQKHAEAQAQAERARADAEIRDAQERANVQIATAREEAAQRVAAASADAEERIEEAKAQAAQNIADARAAATKQIEAEKAAAKAELEQVRRDCAEEHSRELAEAAKLHEAEISQVKKEMEQRISSLIHDLEQTEKARVHAEKRADGNSLSRYLLNRLRGIENVGENDEADGTHR